MATSYPLTVGRTKRMEHTADELALQEVVTRLKGLVTVGTAAPGATTQGTLYVQYAADSYTRLWVKVDGTWR